MHSRDERKPNFGLVFKKPNWTQKVKPEISVSVAFLKTKLISYKQSVFEPFSQSWRNEKPLCPITVMHSIESRLYLEWTRPAVCGSVPWSNQFLYNKLLTHVLSEIECTCCVFKKHVLMSLESIYFLHKGWAVLYLCTVHRQHCPFPESAKINPNNIQSGIVYWLHCVTLTVFTALESSWRRICLVAAALHSDYL